MKNHLFILFLISLVLFSSLGYAQEYDASISKGENGGFIVAKFKDKEFSLLDIFQQQAIIPTFVNADSTIIFKGELRKVSDFTGFLFGSPDNLVIRIYKFDSTKPNFIGSQVNSFTISIPSSVQQSFSNPLITSIIFDAQMTSPSQIGKYRYESEPRTGSFREASVEIDYDTFEVQQGVPEICQLPSVDETINNIDGGELRIITTTEYSGLSCTKNVIIIYDATCNEGYKESGSGSSTKCEKIITPPTDPPEEKQVCKTTEVCCEIPLFSGDKRLIDNPDGKINQCTIPSECGFFAKYPQSKAVAVSNCDGSSPPNPTQICGDGNIQNPETCDDENTINGDGCSSICKIEGDGGGTTGTKGIFETLLETKTKTELEKSKCKEDLNCEQGSDCAPFSNLPTKTQERLSEGWWNVAEEGICVIPKIEGDGLDLDKWGENLADIYGIDDVGFAWGITIIGGIIIFMLIQNLFSRGK